MPYDPYIDETHGLSGESESPEQAKDAPESESPEQAKGSEEMPWDKTLYANKFLALASAGMVSLPNYCRDDVKAEALIAKKQVLSTLNQKTKEGAPVEVALFVKYIETIFQVFWG